MARYSDILTNKVDGTPIAGARVSVTLPTSNTLAHLQDDAGNDLTNPVVTNAFGAYSFNAPDALYNLAFMYGGRVVGEKESVIVGNASTLPPGSVFNSLGSSATIAPSQAAVAGGLNGRVTLISLASQASSQAIATDLVATSGHEQTGLGSWWYTRDHTATSSTALTDSDGNKFRLSRFAIPSAVVTGALGISDINGTLVDEAPYLQALADGMVADCPTLPGKSGGGVQRLDPTRPIYINQPVTLKWVRLVGEYRRGEILGHDVNGNNPDKKAVSLGSQASTIVCGPNGKITLGDGAFLENVAIVSLAAARFIDPANGSTAASVQALLASYANYPVAIDTKNGASDCGVEGCLIAGFNLGMKFVYNERYRFEGNKVDCINGFYQSQTYDYSWCRSNEFYPFVWAHRLVSGGETCLAAYGTGIKYDTGLDTTRSIDGGSCTDNMVYGYNVDYDFYSTNGLYVGMNWADNDLGRPDRDNTIGIRTSGNCRRSKFIGNTVETHGRGIDCQGSGSVWDDNTTAGCSVSHFRYGASADIIGGLHLFQGPSPLYIEVTEGPGRVTWSQSSFFDVNAPLIALLGGGLPSSATRAKIDLGKVVHQREGNGYGFDPRQWKTHVEVDNSAASQTFNGDYAKVTLATKSFSGSPIDGYGEWVNGSFVPKYDGVYLFTPVVDGSVSTAAIVSTQLRLLGVAQEISQDTKQLTAAAALTLGRPVPLFVPAGQAVDLWVSANAGFTVGAGKAVMTVVRIN